MDKQQQLENLRYELRTEQQKLAAADQNKVAVLTQQIADLEQEIEQEARLAEYSQREEEAHAEIAYILDGLEVDGMKMRQLCSNEGAYQVLRIAVQEMMSDRDRKYLEELKRTQEEAAAVKKERDDLQKQYDELYEQTDSLKKDLQAAQEEIADLGQKRDAAAQEITRLNSHIDDLRAEAAVGASAAIKVINSNTSGELAKAVEVYKKSLPAIYDVQQIDNKGSQFTAKLAETDEEISFGWLEKGKYREVTAEEADQFRREAEEQKRANEDMAQSGGVEKADIVELPTQFQTQEDTADRMAQGDTSEQMAGTTVTREEFEELKRRVVIVEKLVKRPEEVA
ncbi:hypothetical protein H7K28_06805 [Paenibacillus polymyxa]|uniref:hypothetical protein n=1 Tax=Paenibacillus polymyxa TaxID=1406 RepID=UPI0015805F56|nr:hypothetical protein [Paenibacillus polymyxa]MBY0020741.1 hypothetical protein [Paenibacillus polymyxa]MBY0059045.1 hypothetical protein [Paenibacillus polymyxa]MBY0069632.1 hypothetical protein [Paenibacillus polymyxa]MBY0078874.1 hypothetical protein [Paenibacillus polymyxa]MBZ6441852.1 hypothetical protein [Paenibacillus polymyxa]